MRSVILCFSAELRRKDQKSDELHCVPDRLDSLELVGAAVQELNDYTFRKGHFHCKVHGPRANQGAKVRATHPFSRHYFS